MSFLWIPDHVGDDNLPSFPATAGNPGAMEPARVKLVVASLMLFGHGKHRID